MLDGITHFDCICGSADHTLRFILDKDEDNRGLPYYSPAIYIDVFLPDWPWYKRLWLGLKYIFIGAGKCAQWQSWELNPKDASKMKSLLEGLESCSD
jgi:hypothetical protein